MRAHRAGLSIIEEPISFGVRMLGESKLSGDVVVEGARLLVNAAARPLVADPRSVDRGNRSGR